MKIETLAVHAGRRVDPATGAVALPIHLSTTFERDPDGSYPRRFLYARTDNPTRSALEACLAALEGGTAAAAFASASAATSAVLQALAPGDHVVAPADAYHGTLRLLRETFTRWGLSNVHQEKFAFGKGWTLNRFSAHMIEPQVQPIIGTPAEVPLPRTVMRAGRVLRAG